MLLSIIIVNYNVKYFLEQCLCSVITACKNIDTQILVVDNNSTDGSKAFFEGRFNNVQFIWCEENAGFSKANNLGLTKAVGQYILFLNPDTILPEDCLEKCITYFNKTGIEGGLGIRMIDGTGQYLKESKRGFPGTFTAFCKLSGLTALFPNSKIFARYYLGHLNEFENAEIEVLAGAFIMVAKKVLDQVGGFDERFFMYGEDIDLSYRIKKAGFKNIYFAESTILHFKGESTKKGSLNYVRLFYGAMSLFVDKHYTSNIGRLYNIVIQIAIWMKAFVAVLGQPFIKYKKNYNKKQYADPCYIVANQDNFITIKSILQKTNLNQQIAERIDPFQIIEAETLKNTAHLNKLFLSHPPKEMIFCIDDISAKSCINFIQLLPAGTSFKFHFINTNSIVGSNQA